MAKIAIIGGSGIAKIFKGEKDIIHVKTPFGISQPIAILEIEGKEVLFTNRHAMPGSKSFEHAIPPHRINSRALIYSLAKEGAERIIALNSVGSLSYENKIGSFLLPDQFIDFTKRREYTFFEGIYRGEDEVLGDSSRILHVDMTRPFCEELNEEIFKTCKELGYEVKLGGCYVCTEGPRLETSAEINMFKAMGASVVGMTLVPEIILARELKICYSSISIITNYAAGMQERVSFEEVKNVYKSLEDKISILLRKVIARINESRRCGCNK